MSSNSKMLAILDLFSEKHPVWSTEAIINHFGFSVPTGYRYLKELTSSGLLTTDNGFYSIGPKIIELDYLFRKTDPIIQAGIPVMKRLHERTGCEVLLSNMYNNEILIVHIETLNLNDSKVKYNRGQPHPLFYGSTSKSILAHLPRLQLGKLYEEFPEDIRKAGLGESFNEFKAEMSAIKKQGIYISHGELDDGVSGIAAPIFRNNSVKGSLSLVFATEWLEIYNIEKLKELVLKAAEEISSLEFLNVDIFK